MLVRRASEGDARAWDELVTEFEDVALGLAYRWTGDPEVARDVAQDAFVLAFTRLSSLRDEAAFPGWFSRVVRTAASRHHRRRPRSVTTAEVVGDPDAHVLVALERDEVWAAVRALPRHERTVVALHYLAGLTYAEVAALLGISPGAVKKRAFSARVRLRGIISAVTVEAVTEDATTDTAGAPSISLFAAIRSGNVGMVRSLVAQDPDLLHATERWTPEQAMRLGLQNAEDGKPLVRAVQTGNLDMVRALLAAGLDVDDRCACAGRETALWAAVQYGDRDLVDELLAAGADVDAAAFDGVTPLILAAQLRDDQMVNHLMRRGADTQRTDGSGRTAAEWLSHRTDPSGAAGAAFVETGVRAIDLLAPLSTGAAVIVPPAWEVGAMALVHEIVRAVAPDEFWQVGFETPPYDTNSARLALRQLRLTSRVRLSTSGAAAGAASEEFAVSLAELERSARTKIVSVIAPPRHELDVVVALARLRQNNTIKITFVIVPGPTTAAPDVSPPEGFDAQFAFDVRLAKRGIFPALDPERTSSRHYTSDEHRSLAVRARDVLRSGAFDSRTTNEVRRALEQYLAQPFIGWEHLTNRPGESTPVDETLAAVASIIGRGGRPHEPRRHRRA